MHTRVVGGARGVVLLVDLVHAPAVIAAKRNGAVLGHDGIDGPLRCKWLTPADGAAGDRDDVQTCGLQCRQRIQCVLRDRAVGGEGVVDVGKDAADLGSGHRAPVREGMHG
ncbi:hypothetical protein SDC9_175639 [bioreactor metagenome]|uniref:Uncharacterized protein n=1 Tax=bioreactor metagenome TaxID=1076179 RepID=A0A645GQM9_9ZZZZ